MDANALASAATKVACEVFAGAGADLSAGQEDVPTENHPQGLSHETSVVLRVRWPREPWMGGNEGASGCVPFFLSEAARLEDAAIEDRLRIRCVALREEFLRLKGKQAA